MNLSFVDLDALERVARVIGPSSAAAQALDSYRQRRAAGERVAVFRDTADGCLVVGPVPAEIDPVKDH